VEGQFRTVDTTSNRTLIGNGNPLYTRGWFAGGGSIGPVKLVIDNLPIVIRPGDIMDPSSSHVVFQNFADAATQLTIIRGDGITESVSLNSYIFSTIPTTGYLVVVDDADDQSNTLLTVDLPQIFAPVPSDPQGRALNADGLVTFLWAGTLIP
jgi:hypothetical protein